MEKFKNWIYRYGWIICLIVFAVLLIGGARAHSLWGDEAETGIYARNISSFGKVIGWDGVNILGLQNGAWLNQELINRANPWMQYFVAAASFRLFGVSALSARLPFMLISLVSFVLWYRVCFELTGNKRLALLGSAILATSIQYVLYAYQARYYSLTIFGGILMVWTAGKLMGKSWWPKILFVLASVFFVYSHYFSYGVFVLALGLAYILYLSLQRAKPKQILRFLVWYGGLTLVAIASFLPWYLKYLPFNERMSLASLGFKDWVYWPLVVWYTYIPFNLSNVFPVAFWLIAGWLVWRLRQKREERALLGFLVAIPVLYLMFVAVLIMGVKANNAFTSSRYNTVLIPLWTFLGAYLLWQTWLWRKSVAVVLFGLWALTNLLTLPGLPQSYFLEYLGEITVPYPTSPTIVANYLEMHAKTGETAFVTSDREHEPLIFLLDKKLKFVNRVTLLAETIFPANLDKLPRYVYNQIAQPDWIIQYSKLPYDYSFWLFDQRDWRVFPGINLNRDYDETVLPIYFADRSRPELGVHTFKAIQPMVNEQIFIYHLKK